MSLLGRRRRRRSKKRRRRRRKRSNERLPKKTMLEAKWRYGCDI